MKTIFVKLEEYEELTKTLTAVNDKIAEARTLLEKLDMLRAEEEKQLRDWQATLENVKGRVEEITTALTPEER